MSICQHQEELHSDSLLIWIDNNFYSVQKALRFLYFFIYMKNYTAELIGVFACIYNFYILTFQKIIILLMVSVE